MRKLLSITTVLLVLSGLLACRDNPTDDNDEDVPDGPTGTVVGAVYDFHTGQPLPGAELFLGERQAWADDNGVFRIEAVPVGTHALRFQYWRYNDWSEIVDVREDEETEVEARISSWDRFVIGISFLSASPPLVANPPVHHPATVVSGVSSPYSITEVTARIEDEIVAMTYGLVPVSSRNPDSAWMGTFSLSEYASPSLRRVVVRAQNANGDSATASRHFLFDQPPSLTVLLPDAPVVANPSARVHAICQDDDPAGCRQIIVWTGHTSAAAEGSVLNADVDFADLIGFRVVQARIIAEDHAGQKTEVVRTVYVDNSPSNVPVADVSPAVLVDANATHLLATRFTGTTDTLILFDRVSGPRTVVYAQEGMDVSRALLTAGDEVLWMVHPSNNGVPARPLYRWHDGTVQQLHPGVPYDRSLVADGDWVLYPGIRQNFVTGEADAVGYTGELGGLGDIGPDGTVVYGRPHIYRDTDGEVTQLTTSGIHEEPLTDGIRVLYRRQPTLNGLTGPYDIVLHDGGGGTVLSTLPFSPSGPSEFQAAGGWVAFVRPDQTGVQQVWVRSPADQERQVTIFNSPSRIELLKSDGTVVTLGQTEGRYRAAPGGSPVRIGTGAGTALFIDGVLHVMVGPALFRVN